MKDSILLVGAGISNAVIADLLGDKYDVVVFDKNYFIGGSCYTYLKNGIEIHKFGPHIFRTNNEDTWKYVNKFTDFNGFINCPVALYDGTIYNLPFNMNTFSKIWPDVVTPEDAHKKIDKEIKESGIDCKNPTNLEEKAISLVGTTIYKMLIKEYTEKQWGKDCKELSSDIISRLPLRFTYDNNYSNAKYQGIPTIGYTNMIKKMFNKSIVYNCVAIDKKYLDNYAQRYKYVFYSGRVDSLLKYMFGELEFRGLKWSFEKRDMNNYQGVAVVNHTSHENKFTRVIEHKHFRFSDNLPYTYISKEYPCDGKENPFYPIKSERNFSMYEKYKNYMKNNYKNVVLCGRLGLYEYLDMDKAIERSIGILKEIGEL